MDDQRMPEEILRGDVAAFEDFYRNTATPLKNFLVLYVGDRQVAEDLSQETLMQLWQRPNGFDPAKSTLRAYVFGIARHRAADWWRKKQPRPPTPQESVEPQGERRAMMENALAQLDPDARGVLWLREVEGHSYEELAGMLNIPVGTVCSRLSAAREQLRRIWKSKPQSI